MKEAPTTRAKLLALGVGACMALGASPAFAQSTAFYGTSKSTFTYESIQDKSLTANTLCQFNCTSRRIVNLPFTFDYLGNNYNTAYISPHGYITFLSNDTTGSRPFFASSYSLPDTGVPNQMIAAFWNYFEVFSGTNYRLQWASEGTAPNRVVHIEWQNLQARIVGSGDADFMISLFEDGHFEVTYGGSFVNNTTFGDEGVVGYESTGNRSDFWDYFDDCSATETCDASAYNNDLVGNKFTVEKAIEPELRIDIESFVNGALPGQTATGTIAIINLGQNTASNVDARMYLSTDDQFDPATDTLIGTFADVVATAPNGRNPVQVTANIPASIGADLTYHVILEVDYNDEFDEVVEEDNVFISEDPFFGTGYDLEISGCELVEPASGINPGQTGTFAVQINNLGAPYTGDLGPLDIQLLASQDNIPDSNDANLGTRSVPVNQLRNERQYTVLVDGTLPSTGVPPGLYYPICTADPVPPNTIPELNMRDSNVFVAPSEKRFQSGADFAPTNVTFNTEVPMGTPLDLNITISSLAVPTIRNVEYSVYASQDDVFEPGGADFLLTTGTARFEDTQTLEIVEERSITLPASLPGGRWRVFVQTDPTGRITEVSEANNILLSGSPEAPNSTFEFLNAIDFSVANVTSTGGTLQAGDTIRVNFDATSDGLRFTGFVPFAVFASVGTEFNFGDILLGTGQMYFPASTTNPTTIGVEAELEISPNIPPGQYNVCVLVDRNDDFLEATEANNAGCDAVPNPVFQLQGADLVADSLVTRRFAFASRPGQESTIPVQLIAENDGEIDARGWRYVYVWSKDPNVRIDDDVVFESTVQNLDADESAEFIDEVPVPVRTSTDCLFLGVSLDFFGDIPDRALANNQRIAGVTDGPVPLDSPDQAVDGRTCVTIVQPAPDYEARIIFTATVAAGGEELAITRSIANLGNALGANAGYAYYLSLNSTISPDDDIQLLPVGSTSEFVSIDDATNFFRIDLVAGADDIAADFVRVPESIAGGQAYYLGIVANPGLEQREVFVENNVDRTAEPFPVSNADIQFLTRAFPRATSGVGYEVGVYAQGGPQPITWGVTPGSELPPGTDEDGNPTPDGRLQLDADTGIISGIPTEEGRFDFSLRAFSGTAFADREFFIIVTPPTVSLEIVSRSLPSGVANREYDVQVIAIGGAPPYTWEIRNLEELPPPLEFSEDGRVRGVPAAPASRSLLFRVTDSLGVEASRELPLRILNPNQTVQIQNVQTPSFVINESFPCDDPDFPAFRFTAQGGIPEYRWSAVSDLPPGLMLESDGRLCGTPTQVGVFPLEVRVQDQFDPLNPDLSREGLFDTALFIIEVDTDNDLAIVGVAVPEASQGEAYTFDLQAIGGTEPYVWDVVPEVSDLPEGVQVDPAGQLSGTPTEGGNFGFVIRVTDQDGRVDTQPLSLQVAGLAFCELPENADSDVCNPTDPGGCTSMEVSDQPLGVTSLLLLAGLAFLAVRRRKEIR